MKKELLIALITFIFSYSCTDQIKNTKELSYKPPADSLYIVGKNYLNEDTDNPKYDSAEFYLSEAANLNYSKAYYTLGYEYALGHRLKNNKEKGVEYLKKAADLGVIEAYYSLAQLYYYQNDIENVQTMLEKGTDAGDGVASHELYLLYFYGSAFGETEKKHIDLIDEKKGFEYLVKAAEMENFDAQISLAYSYKNGLSGLLSPDEEKSLYYFEKAENNPELHEIPGAVDELEIAKKELNF